MKQLIFSLSLIVCILFFSTKSIGQEQIGLHLENYAGINAIAINPANSFLTPHTWDINIISAGFFFSNNYAFLRNTNTFHLLKNLPKLNIKFDSLYSPESIYSANTILLDFYNSNRKGYVSILGNLTGPSFSFKLGENNSIGFVSAFRFFGSIQNIPKELSYYPYYDRPFFEQFKIPTLNAGFISWQEYGINYVRKIDGYSTKTLVGVTLKYLSGNEAGYFENKKLIEYQKMPNDSAAAINGVHLKYGYTTTNLEVKKPQIEKNGAGFSIDFGATIVFGDDIEDYKFRLGASLLDLGFINFNKNSLAYDVNIDTMTIVDADEFKEVSNLMELEMASKILSKQVLKDSLLSFEAKDFKMWLPAALSFQFDYSFSKLFYVNGTLIQRLPFKNHAANRGNLFVISPRIEHRWFAVSTPLIIYNWKDFRIGTSVRFGYLIVGSDDILSLFANQAHYSGSDLYAGVKFNPFSIGKRKRHRQRGGKVKCYEF